MVVAEDGVYKEVLCVWGLHLGRSQECLERGSQS